MSILDTDAVSRIVYDKEIAPAGPIVIIDQLSDRMVQLILRLGLRIQFHNTG